jgi:hypothetical protein
MKKIKLLFFALVVLLTTDGKLVAQITSDTSQIGYIILAEKEAVFGKYNYINGNVGVRAAHGRAEFGAYDILDPYEVRARYVSVSPQADVHNITRSPAGCTSLPTFYPYNGNTRGLRNTEVRVNGTLNGNWNDVTVKRGVIATITGNNFGRITIERGANVTFTAAIINLEELKVENGRSPLSFTIVNFSNETAVKVKDQVTVEAYTRVNVGGPQVTLHVGDNRGGEENFLVKGEDNQVTANIIVPNGKLKVEGGSFTAWPTVMTGWYVIEKLDVSCKFVYWNQSFSEKAELSSFAERNSDVLQKKNIVNGEVVNQANELRVKVYPNPSSSYFIIQVDSKNTEPVTVRILDMNGRLMSAQTKQLKTGNITVGADLPQGIYIAEIKQGKNIKTSKLVKK